MAPEADQYKRQIQNVAMVYGIYRIVLPMLLLVTYVSDPENGVLGIVSPDLFLQTAIAFAIFGTLAIFSTHSYPKLIGSIPYQLGSLLIDVLFVTLLMYCSGGVISGLGLLLIVTIACASILIRGRTSTFIAASATIAVIYSEIYISLSLNGYSGQFLQAGILGVLLFATSLFVQAVNNRAYKTAMLAVEQASSIVDLEKLNNEIIQRMRTGIMVVRDNNQVVTMNNAARSLLSPILKMELVEGKEQFQIPDILQDHLDNWRSNPYQQGFPIQIPNSSTRLQVNFTFLSKEENSDILLFIENQKRIMQRISQSKLVSLGRLTANIAHEVRNPLGAISHASQILKESDSIPEEDKRMLDIILNHSSRVNRIIEDVLDASRHKDVSAGIIQLEKWLNDFVKHYKESNRQCEEIVLEINPKDIEVRVIESQLERVLTNLFDNGLRYSEKATGKATLIVNAGVRSGIDGGPQPFISVIDQGPGLKEEAEAQLFEPFHTTEATGTGLGLYISKELCEANQATLDYSITDAGTSCFSIYFSNPHLGMA